MSSGPRAAARTAPSASGAPRRATVNDLGIGLAGGIDKDGSRAAELLAAGFDSVEFGSVAAGIAGYPDASAAALAARLAAYRAVHCAAPRSGAEAAAPHIGIETGIGIGIGRPAGAPPAALTDCWLAGLEAVAGVADYVSFNLTAAANRLLLAPEHRSLLAHSFAAVAGWRDAQAAAGGRRLHLAAKLPLGAHGEPLPSAARLAAAAGFERLSVVRPDGETDFLRLAVLARHVDAGTALVAVGGIRCADDVAAAWNAGAAGVQVHRLFVEQGTGCVARLRAAA